MAKIDKPRIFAKVIDGLEQQMLAHTPADAVRYVYDGWREVVDEPTPPAPRAEKPAAPKR